ncbi:MAG: enoyl-CoA hydratase/isomerase family protein, partial [Gaiellaceae bacterium]
MSAVEYEVRDRIGYARLNRPRALNAIDEEVLAALAGLVETVAGDEDVKAFVLTGTGDAFCVGLDLGLLERAFADTAYFRDVLVRLKDLLLGLEALPMPVVAAVNGTTRAGGFEIMLACDLVLVADEARIGDTHLAYGIVPGGGATQRLPRLVGMQRARDLIYTGRWIDGCEAVEAGLALRSVPSAGLDTAVEELVGVFRNRSRAALAATKTAMRQGVTPALEAG